MNEQLKGKIFQDRRNRSILLTLAFLLILEICALVVMVYFAKVPEYVSLLIFFFQLVSPWFLGFNLIFLLYTLFTKGIRFTAEFWRAYAKELLRFFTLSFFVALLVIIVSAALGILLGLSAERLSELPTMKMLRGWVNRHFY